MSEVWGNWFLGGFILYAIGALVQLLMYSIRFAAHDINTAMAMA